MRRVAVLAIALLTLSSPATAQAPKPIELGLDGAVSYTLNSPHITGVSLPVSLLRVGVFLSPTVSIEPFGSLYRTSENNNSVTSLNIGAGALFHFGTRNQTQPYVRPFAVIVHSGFDGSNGSTSDNVFGLAAGLGIKIPVANQFAWRLEGAVTHALEHDQSDKNTALSLAFGFSFFTH